LLTYLRLLNLPVGLLINFGVATFKKGIIRVVKKILPSVGFVMKMTTQAAGACRFSFFGHETGIMGIYFEYIMLYIIYKNKHQDFASSRE